MFQSVDLVWKRTVENLVVVLPIFVADTKIIFHANFAVSFKSGLDDYMFR